jgi:hypothetical protein
MSVDYRRSHVYAAEYEAFEGTILREDLPFAELAAIANQVLRSTWWADTGGRSVTIAESEYLDCSYWKRSTNTVAFVPTEGRCAVAHELAHALHDFNGNEASRRAHGPEWRGWYVVTVYAMYGHKLAGLLSDAYARYNLPVELPFTTLPVVPLCQFELPAPQVGGWKRFR